MLTRRDAVIAGALLPFIAREAAAVDITDPENTLIMDLAGGTVTIALKPDVAPRHVERIKMLTREGTYDNVAFHRVIPGFMAQTGDVQHGNMESGFDARRVGTGGSRHANLPAEFSDTPFRRGTLGMARSQSPDSANSQFFICFEDADWLNGQYTVFGEVIDGMEHVDAIKAGSRANNGMIDGTPDRIVSLRVAADG